MLDEAAADVFARAAVDAVRRTGRFSVALAGGSTPKGLYSRLATDVRCRNLVPWSEIDFFWGDERHVPPGDPQSNYRMANETMLSKVPAQPERVHRVQSEHADAALVAEWYEADISASIASRAGTPCFDLIVLGIGVDGHTASLFPGTAALAEGNRLVVANWVEMLSAHRITMTFPLINAARLVIFLAAGEEKADVLRRILEPKGPARNLPAQLVRPIDGEVLWLLDGAAASLLNASLITGT